MFQLATKFAPREPHFRLALDAGFRCAELWLDAAVLARWREVAALAQAYPMEYALHFPNRLEPAQAPEVLEQATALYQELGCRCLVIHQPMADRYAAALLARQPALRLAVENHRLTPERFSEWAEQNPGLALDVEHLWMFTLPDAPLRQLLAAARDCLARFGGKVRHVHLPGYLPGFAEHRPMYCGREMVFPVLSLLAEFGFGGLAVSEVNVEYQNSNELAMDVLFFDAWRQWHDGKRATALPAAEGHAD